jgi:hypothetical protein
VALLEKALNVFDGNGGVVDQDPNGQRQSAEPISPRMMMDERIDNGIEIAMISVDLQLPRNTRIINAVSAAAMTASRITP